MELCPLGAKLFPHRQTDMTKLIATFLYFVSTAKNSCYLALMPRSNQPKFHDRHVISQTA